jgi:hypothetical protein
VRYLYLDESLSAFVDEETGLDSFGAEEFKLKLTIDGKPLPLLGEWTWHDADNHEIWNNLTTAVTQSAKAALGRDVRSLSFCNEVTAEYWKSDVTFGEDVHTWQFTGPAEDGPKDIAFAKRYTATAFSDGVSTFRVKISKFPLLPI